MNLPPEFTPMIVPPYRDAERGEWTLYLKPCKHRRVLGYFRNEVPIAARNWTLMKRDRVWMSITPMELESQGYHARLAHGNVLVLGLGMGVLVYNLLQNPKVETVTVVEQDYNVVELVRSATDGWLDLVEVRVMDAFKLTRSNYDVMLADIWPALGDMRIESDMQRLQGSVCAKMIGWWGQELSLVSWLGKIMRTAPITREDLRAYERVWQSRIIGFSHESYPALALRAAELLSCARLQRDSILVEDALNAIGGVLL